MRTYCPGRLTAASAVALFAASAGPALAQTNEELMDIIRQQQRQIEELSRRVEEIQKEAEAEAVEPAAPPESQVVVDYEGSPIPTIELYKTNDAGEREKIFDFKPRGRLLVDGGYLDDDDGFFSNDNATELRAARLGFEGTAWRDFEYKLEADFADNEVDLADAFIEYGGPFLDPAYVRVGQFKTPNSLEEQTSSRFITFMERAAITDAFDLDRRIGLGSGVGGDNWAFNAGLFGQNVGDVENDEGYAAAGRGHYALVDTFGEDSAIHLGASARFRDLDNDADASEVRYRQRPFFHFTGTRLADTGDVPDAENDIFAGGELALVLGPFSVQAEAAHTWLQRDDADDADGLWGGYIDASYFLTGESRNYEADEGIFGRVRVANPVHEGGLGAWQIGARLDYIDLNDDGADVTGGEMYSAIAGINWYMNNHVRFMLNYAFSRVDDAEDSPSAAADGDSNYVHGVGGRFQVDF